MRLSDNQKVFFELLRAGLWETDVQLAPYGEVSFTVILALAQEQSVVGIVSAGLEHVTDIKIPQAVILQFVGQTLQIELRNKEMNSFLPEFMERLKSTWVKALLVKGPGVAQCYERPLWRACGDLDLLLDFENYEKAKALMAPIADKVEEENKRTLHQALKVKGFDVELHGKMPFLLSKRVDYIIDETLTDSLSNGGVTTLSAEGKDVFLPNVDNHLFLVFTHFLHHFFIEGVGLRQIQDWCRMLWTYKDSLDLILLEKRIKSSGLMSEWRTFAAFAVSYLGMPREAMPFYQAGYEGRARKVLSLVIKSGNFGQNKDLSYRVKYKGATYKLVSFWRRLCDFTAFATIFPADAPRFFLTYLSEKI